jgi:hypothetical protein
MLKARTSRYRRIWTDHCDPAETPEGVTHRDYVTRAWTDHPVKDVLVKIAATPALTRVATSTPSSEGR